MLCYSEITDNMILEKTNVFVEKSSTYINGERVPINYLQCVMSFDIETSSFYVNNEKYACMYMWQFDLNGLCFYGRKWDEFVDLMNRIVRLRNITDTNRIVIYVHNLSYEFQWMHKYFDWLNVFAREARKPIRAVTVNGIEFRCSYFLSGYGLAKVAENLTLHSIRKLKEKMNYSLIRTPITPLDDDTLQYAENDVKILEYYIRECILHDGGISKIPLTKTSYVRLRCKQNCFKKRDKASTNFRKTMSVMTIPDKDYYEQMLRAFAGGMTHANCWRVGRTYDNVYSFDETSAYPAVIVSEMFPMSAPILIEDVDETKLKDMMQYYLLIFDCTFINIEPKLNFESTLSYSKCWDVKEPIINNGRIFCADQLSTTITSVDYEYLSLYYSWDEMIISNCTYYIKGFLPKQIIETTLELYYNKTTLKGIEGKEAEYLREKEDLNSMYGMCVTNIVNDDITFENHIWGNSEKNIEEVIEKYNKQRTRFLFYPWGIFITAYARRNLLVTAAKIGDDYIYSDTDSLKVLNGKKNIKIFEEYNQNMLKKLQIAMGYHGLDLEKVRPKDINGTVHTLGFWEIDGVYKQFKTLGAKRYIYTDEKGLHVTIAGSNKKDTAKYLVKEAKKITDSGVKTTPFDLFKNDLSVPEEYSGRKLFTYLDDEFEVEIEDYMGNRYVVHELSGVHIESEKYTMHPVQVFVDFLNGIQSGLFC